MSRIGKMPVTVPAGVEVTIGEQTLITDYVRKLVGQDVDMIWGYGLDESLEDKLRVAIIATVSITRRWKTAR